jgi:hypothetical protein
MYRKGMNIISMTRIRCSVWISLFAAALLSLSGCATPTVYIPVKEGIIASPNVTLEARDGSFTLVSGKPFAPPFQMKCFGSEGVIRSTKLHTSQYPEYLKAGAKQVWIKIEGRGKPFHGLLALCQAFRESIGPAAKSYKIEITPDQIEAAAHGRIVMLFEWVAVNESGPEGQGIAWVLFISDRPFE